MLVVRESLRAKTLFPKPTTNGCLHQAINTLLPPASHAQPPSHPKCVSIFKLLDRSSYSVFSTNNKVKKSFSNNKISHNKVNNIYKINLYKTNGQTRNLEIKKKHHLFWNEAVRSTCLICFSLRDEIS